MGVKLGQDIEFTPVSPHYLKAEYITHAISAGFFIGIPLIVAVLVTVLADSLVWTIVLWCVVGFAVVWGLIEALLIKRRVAAIGYAELDDTLAIRRGVMFRNLVLVPYGRMQQVNVETGPILSRFGLANVELVTASSDSNADIPGLPLAEAERLREKLVSLGQAQMEGI